MSYANDAPAAAWYPDPHTSGQVRWWDGTKWTEHVSKPAVEAAEVTVDDVVEATPVAAPIVPQVAEADAAFAAADSGAATTISAGHTVADDSVADHFATVTFIGRHAAGATPVPRQPSTAPRIRPRERGMVPVESSVESPVEALAFA